MTDPYITREELQELQPDVDTGKATVQVYHDPDVISLRRRDANGSVQTVAQFTPIRITLDERQEAMTGENAGRVQVVNTGTFETFGDLDIRRDDRFRFGGQPCTVTRADVPKNLFGYRIVHFDYNGGK